MWGLIRLFHKPRRHATIELEPAHQVVLLTLARFGDCSFQRLRAELEAVRGTSPAEMVVAVIRLERDGVIERASEPLGSRQQAVYRLTKVGRRAVRVVPPAPTSSLDFYV